MDYTNGYTMPIGSEIAYAKSLYILGEASNGPTNTPMLIENIEQCKSIFGTGTLTGAWCEAYQTVGNDANVYLVRINGEPSEFTMVGIGSTIGSYDAIKIISTESGAIWNEVSIMFADEYIRISNPEEIGGYEVFYYDDYQTLSQLTNAINEANNVGSIGVRAYCNDQFRSVNDIRMNYRGAQYENFYMYYGDDETFLSKNELHAKLDMTYNILVGQSIDMLCVVGAYFDDISPIAHYGETEYGEIFYNSRRDYLDVENKNDYTKPGTFHGQLIEFCKAQMNQNILTHGVMAFNPVENIEDILRINGYSMKAANASCFSDRHDIVSQNNGTEDYGKYISVVIGEFEYVDIYGRRYYNNGYIAYAATLASRLTSDSPTNMVIPNVNGLRYHLDDEEILFLSKLGIVTFRKSILKNAIVVSNGVTAALSSSPFHVVSNVRMTQLIMSAYNTTLQVFVGEDVDRLSNTNEMHKAVERLTKALIQDRVAKDISATLEISPVGVALLTVSIMCNYSIEYVTASTNIKL